MGTLHRGWRGWGEGGREKGGGCGRFTWPSILGTSKLNPDNSPPEEWACLWLTHSETAVQRDYISDMANVTQPSQVVEAV